MRPTLCYLVLALLVAGIAPKPAYAYLDPGTMSLWVQGIVATIAGALATSSFWWSKLKSIFKAESKGEPEILTKPDQDRETK